MRLSLPVASALLLLVVVGCRSRASEFESEPSAAHAGTQFSGDSGPGTRVSLIVFVGMDQACACTRARIEKSWKALDDALAGSPDVTVKRIQWDMDKKEAENYSNIKPLMALPGIYFLDDEGRLIEQLQGEVTPEQIAALIK